MLVRKVLQNGFSEKLDENLDVFVMRNGLIDLRTRTFREVRSDDMVSTHADWDYNREQAAAKRTALDAFLRQVLPVDEERRTFLTYMAGLLSGRRLIKKLIILTDRRAGNNGKSTLSRHAQGVHRRRRRTSRGAKVRFRGVVRFGTSLGRPGSCSSLTRVTPRRLTPRTRPF